MVKESKSPTWCAASARCTTDTSEASLKAADQLTQELTSPGRFYHYHQGISHL
jgi:hypothetical protein